MGHFPGKLPELFQMAPVVISSQLARTEKWRRQAATSGVPGSPGKCPIAKKATAKPQKVHKEYPKMTRLYHMQ